MATYRVMAWRGIPTQVPAADEKGTAITVQLPAFFMQEVDRVAMREDLIDSDEYLEGWAWSERADQDGTAEEVANAIALHVAQEWKDSQPSR
jgi:hypothetical protein